MGDTARLQRVKRTTVSTEVQSQLAGLIERGAYPVGEKLPSELELARSFGVSRSAVREALGSLRSLGLVTSRTGSGTFVTAPSAKAALSLQGQYSSDDLHEVRMHLEIPGTALAARRRSPGDLLELHRIIDLQKDVSDIEEWAALDVAFHCALAYATRNAVQYLLVSRLRELQAELSSAVLGLEGRLERATAEHVAVLRAVEAGNEKRAQVAMRNHLLQIQSAAEALTAPAASS